MSTGSAIAFAMECVEKRYFKKERKTLIAPDKIFKPLENGKQQGTAVDKDEFQKAVSTYYLMIN